MRTFFRSALVAALSWNALSAFAATVTEVAPDKIAGVVAKSDLVVVQFTSPDKTCKYCIGADKRFDEAAAASTIAGLQFVRVQWPIWHKMPDFKPLVNLYGVPVQVVFRKGKEMQAAGGRPASGQELLEQVDAILKLPPAPGKDYAQTLSNAAQEAAAKASATSFKPMTAEQQEVSRQMIRRDFFTAVTKACGDLFPAQAGKYRQNLEQWSVPRKQKLDQATMLLVTRSSREEAAEMSALTEVEKKTLMGWQVDKLGIPMNRAPQQKDCDKLAAGLESAP